MFKNRSYIITCIYTQTKNNLNKNPVILFLARKMTGFFILLSTSYFTILNVLVTDPEYRPLKVITTLYVPTFDLDFGYVIL